MGRACSHGVIGQKNIVAYVNSSNTHRGQSHGPTQPTGDTVPGNTFTRGAFKAIMHPPSPPQGSTVRANTHLGKMMPSGQHTTTVEMTQPIYSHTVIVKTNTYHRRHCHSNTHLLETLSQSTHHLGYTSSELPMQNRCPRNLTLTGGCVAITLITQPLAQPIGDTLLGDMHTPE